MLNPEILNNTDSCTACGACVNICASKSIELRADQEGFLMPFVNNQTCTSCGLCEKTCQASKEKIKIDISQFEGYAGWCRDKQLVFNSSSGGFFSAISERIFSDSGIVFGAKYNYKLKRLEHSNTEDCDISSLRKSKYIESNTLDSFSKVKEYLKQERRVLFCGTPCQIMGLKSYLDVLKVNTDKLLLVDFICHGVPSNDHFTQFARTIEKKLGSELVHIDFRSKIIGWAGNSFVSEYIAANGKSKRKRSTREDLFFLAFFDYLLLRKSCYSCEAIHCHQADLTIGDFWGRSGVIEDYDTGISLVIVNSEKGKSMIETIKKSSNVFIKKLETSQFSYAYKRKEAAYSLELREKTMKKVQENGYIKTLNQKYGHRIFVYQFKEMVKKIIRDKP